MDLIVTSKDLSKNYDLMHRIILCEVKNAREDVIKNILDVCNDIQYMFIERRSAKAHICAVNGSTTKVVIRCKIAEVRDTNGFVEALRKANRVEFFTKGNGEIEIDMFFDNCVREVIDV